MICGHIHRPEIVDIDGVLYCNDGDWVENCTALIEDESGRFSLLRWTEVSDVVAVDAPVSAVALGRAA
jgi:UDP-2,3-diacylglucosamine pyrophosphatase LpxH